MQKCNFLLVFTDFKFFCYLFAWIVIYFYIFYQAVNDELEVYQNCNSKLGYLNKAIHLIKRLRNSNIDIMKLRLSDNKIPETRKLEHLVTGSWSFYLLSCFKIQNMFVCY